MNKMKTKIISICLLILLTISCNDSFLELYPKDEQTEATAFVTYENFKTYAWGLYEVFPGYSDTYFTGDLNGGLFTMMTAGGQTPWSMGNVIVPASDNINWNFSFIRKVNIMLDNIDRSAMNETDRKHWRSVGLFFRSYRYMELLAKFGDVPWIENTLTEKSPELYQPRDSRDVVAANIFRDLIEAEQNIKTNGDGANTINNLVVNALISRFGLFEGTWRKYHGLNESEKYLQAAINASQKIIAKVPNVYNNFDLLFNSEDLSTVREVLLYKQYSPGLTGHALTRRVRTGEMQVEGTRYLVDSYLCTDGRPISTSPLYANTTEYDNFRNRDRRLYLTICPPFKTGDAFSGNITSWTRHANPAFSEYIDIINNASWKGGKSLPTSNFRNLYCTRMPNLASAKNGVFNWGKTWMGYFVWRYYNTTTDVSTNTDVGTTDAPIFRVGEVMLNYAEAAFELGQFTQEVADATINKLRTRGGTKDMTVAQIDAGWDTKRDSDVAPVLWEIRRERVMELATEGFHFDDLRRWKKAEKVLNKQPRGAFISKADYGNSSSTKLQDENGATITGNDTQGYLWYHGAPSGWLPHYYLYPLPLNDLALNKELKQNQGWNK